MKRFILSVILGFIFLSLPKIGIASDGVKYLVITHSNFTNSVSPLVNWHHKRGIKTRVVSKSSWTVQMVKNEILAEYNSQTPPVLKWVLLVGDVNYIPAYTYYYAGNPARPYPSDAYYSFLEGNDWYADVGIGRLSVQNTTELGNQVNKILKYEKDPSLDNWLNKSLLVAAWEKVTNPYFKICKEGVRTYSYTYFTPTFDVAYANDGATNSNVTSSVNNGRNVVNYRGEGAPQMWHSWTGEEPQGSWTNSNINSLNNGNKTPVVFNICCKTHKIDYWGDCLGEAWMKKYPGGAVASLGASEESWSKENDTYDKALYWAFCGSENTAHGLEPPIFDIGWVSNYAAAYMLEHPDSLPQAEENVRMYLWLGDPAMEIWTGVPGVLDVTYPSVVKGNIFNVTVKYGSTPVQNALVCVWKGSEVYQTDNTDDSGIASFSIPMEPYTTAGYMDVTVTAHNYLPHEDSTYLYRAPKLTGCFLINGELLASLHWIWEPGPYTLYEYKLSRYMKGSWQIIYTGTNTSYTDPIPFSPGENRIYVVVVYFSDGELSSGKLSMTAPGGCPYVFSWDGTEFSDDNNILAGSGNGENVSDFYKLRQSLIEENGEYRLELREFENEHSFIDMVKLIAIDHSEDIDIEVLGDNIILPYRDAIAPLYCVDQTGEDWTEVMANPNEGYFEGYEGDTLTMNFGEIESGRYVFLPMASPKSGPIDVAIYNSEAGWQLIQSIYPREHSSVSPVVANHLSNDSLKIQLIWHSYHRLEYAGLGKIRNADYHIKPCPLVSATHSDIGSVKQKLLVDDENYAELLPGDTITLEFEVVGIEPGWVRDFVFVSNGYYLTEENGGSQTAYSNIPLVHSLSLYPNPARNDMDIRFGIPREERVSIKVYDVSGREVKTLVDDRLEAGYHTIRLDGKNLPSGIYFARLETDGYEATKKLVLMK